MNYRDVWPVLLLAALSGSTLQAASVSFTGQFATDDQIQFFSFSVSTGKVVTLQSWAYGGGTNAAATAIPAGGFDSLFSLFTGGGAQIGSFDDDPGCAHTNLKNGACLDAYYQAFLPAGSYTLALTESGNFPNGDLPDGFGQQDSGNFTCPQGFCDIFGNQDNGHWAVDIVGADVATQLPEPSTWFLGTAGLALLGLAVKQNKKQKRGVSR